MLANRARGPWRTQRVGRVGLACLLAVMSGGSVGLVAAQVQAQAENVAPDAQAPPVEEEGEQEDPEQIEREQQDPEQAGSEEGEGEEEPEQEEPEQEAPEQVEPESPGQEAQPESPVAPGGAEPPPDRIIDTQPPARPNNFDRSVRDPRELALDTSNSIYVPDIAEPAPELSHEQDEAARRTEARTLGRVTVLSNVGDPVEDSAPPADEASALPAVQPPPPSAGLRGADLTKSSIAAEQLPLRTARPPNTKADDGWTWWLWALAAAALVLLLPIMLLLTRPTRGN